MPLSQQVNQLTLIFCKKRIFQIYFGFILKFKETPTAYLQFTIYFKLFGNLPYSDSNQFCRSNQLTQNSSHFFLHKWVVSPYRSVTAGLMDICRT